MSRRIKGRFTSPQDPFTGKRYTPFNPGMWPSCAKLRAHYGIADDEIKIWEGLNETWVTNRGDVLCRFRDSERDVIRVMEQQLGGSNYPFVALYPDVHHPEVFALVPIHEMVAEMFAHFDISCFINDGLGGNGLLPRRSLEIDHLDCNKLNTFHRNTLYVSKETNQVKEAYLRSRLGDNWRQKPYDAIVQVVKDYYNDFPSWDGMPTPRNE
jgi:hypothetical protein